MKKENYEKEEWGGWKIVSDMLSNPDENDIYPTSKCYQKLYEFVMAQKNKAQEETKKELLEKIKRMEYKDYREEGEEEFERVEDYREQGFDSFKLRIIKELLKQRLTNN